MLELQSSVEVSLQVGCLPLTHTETCMFFHLRFTLCQPDVNIGNKNQSHYPSAVYSWTLTFTQLPFWPTLPPDFTKYFDVTQTFRLCLKMNTKLEDAFPKCHMLSFYTVSNNFAVTSTSSKCILYL